MEMVAVLLAAFVAVGAWWWLRRQGSSGDAERTLLQQICLGDRAQAERLVDVELSRTPGITRAEAIERAVARHQRDKR
jgi:hypothetical protein